MPTNNFIKIAILGTPNAGKSTLFNKLSKTRDAIVLDRPGVTRDCIEKIIVLENVTYPIKLIDTPGIFKIISPKQKQKIRIPIASNLSNEETLKESVMQKEIIKRTNETIHNSDILLFLFDGLNLFSFEQKDFFNEIRKICKPIISIVNKCENKNNLKGLEEIFSLGISPLLISAEHNIGFGNLLKVIKKNVDELCHQASENSEDNTRYNYSFNEKETPFSPILLEEQIFSGEEKQELDTNQNQIDKQKTIIFSIIGRPNVGKSTLLNSLIGREAQLVADIPGVTRDSIEFEYYHSGIKFKIIDTAGIRKRAKITDSLEKITVSKAIDSINFAHACVILIDATEVATSDYGELLQQDLILASKVFEEGRCVIIALNKWDIVQNPTVLKKRILQSMHYTFSQIFEVPIVMISAQKKQGLRTLFDTIITAEEKWNRRIKTSKLNQWLRDTVNQTPPPTSGFRAPKLKYITQTNSRPPSFVVFCTRSAELPGSYKKFLTNRLCKDLDFSGIPIRLQFKQQSNPYAKPV